MNWLIEVEVGSSGALSKAEAKKFYARAMDELSKLDVFDADFWGEIRKGPVYFAVGVQEAQLPAAAAHGITAIRTAIHAAGGSTPDWPAVDDLEPEPDGPGKWIINFKQASQKPLELQSA